MRRPVLLACAGGALALATLAGAGTHAVVPLPLVGSYEALLPKGAGTAPGRWVLAVGRHGAFVLTTPGLDAVATGPARVEGNTLTLPPDVRRGGTCAGPGIYIWRRDGARLLFARVDDGCRARAFRLTARSWRHFTQYGLVVIVRR